MAPAKSELKDHVINVAGATIGQTISQLYALEVVPIQGRAKRPGTPSVIPSASAAVHSALLVGLDNGNIIGRSCWTAISLIIDSLNKPLTAVMPINIVGFAALRDPATRRAY